jgi:hypothetical protein
MIAIGGQTTRRPNDRARTVTWVDREVANAFRLSACGLPYQFHVESRNVGKTPIFRRGKSNPSPDLDLLRGPIVSLRCGDSRTRITRR